MPKQNKKSLSNIMDEWSQTANFLFPKAVVDKCVVGTTLCPYCKTHEAPVLSEEPHVVLCDRDFLNEKNLAFNPVREGFYNTRIKEVVSLYERCDKILRQLIPTRIEKPTYVVLGRKEGNGTLAQTNSVTRNLLIFPQSFENQCSYYHYNPRTEITEILITLLHEYRHAQQPRALLSGPNGEYSNLVEADADIFATRFLTKYLEEIESNFVLDSGNIILDDERIAKVHWLALGRLYSFYDAFKKPKFFHDTISDVIVNRILADEQNAELLKQLECYDSIFSDRLGFITSRKDFE